MTYEFRGFLDRFSDDALETVWHYSGIGTEFANDAATDFPGRWVMARFLAPVPGSWRDILRRAVRTMGLRRDLASLLALLRQIVSHYRPPVPCLPEGPARLVSQCHSRTDAPTRGSPSAGTRVGEAPTMT